MKLKNGYNRFCLLVLILLQINGNAQSKLPEMGKPMPDFTIKDIRNYKASSVSLNDFKGQWLFLDFWTLYCTACIQSFDKLNKLQNEFAGKVQFLLVGQNDQRNKGIENLFEKLSNKKNLQVPGGFDSVLMKQWDIETVPHIFIIDPNGQLRFIINGADMTPEKIHDLIQGKQVTFNLKKKNTLAGFDADTMVKDNTVLFRSMLTKWNGEHIMPGGLDLDIYVRAVRNFNEHFEKGWSVGQIPLPLLYNYAFIGRMNWLPRDSFYGKYYPSPIIKVKDSSLFQFDNNTGLGLYNYNLKVPDADVNLEYMLKLIQQDLKKVFKYEAVIEKRKMPAWILTANKDAAAKLRTKGGDKYVNEWQTMAAGFTIRNYPAKELLYLINYYFINTSAPFFDETGLSGNIDLTFDADMTNIESIRNALQKHGLNLVKGEKEMKVVVICDPKN